MLSIGLMSGTSMDGIDAALLETDGEFCIRDIGHMHFPYDARTKHLLKGAERAMHSAGGNIALAQATYARSLQDYLTHELGLNQGTHQETTSFEEVTRLSTALHQAAVLSLLEKTKTKPSEVDVIGYHGQTLFHQPHQMITYQLGDAQYLSEQLHISVVYDIRQHDIQHGGQGAPFAPIYHQALAIRDKTFPLAVVNCGGIANISLILGDTLNDLIGFDTGPGNGLIDALIRQRTNGRETMDFNGQYGLQGMVNPLVLKTLLAEAIDGDYLLTPPPKSLDIRDLKLLPILNSLSIQDAAATLEAFTAESIVQSIKQFKFPIPMRWVLAGGGWHNPVIKRELITRLRAHLGDTVEVMTADALQWNSDAMEAQMMAYLAVRSLKNLPLSAPGTTGVPTPLSGGKIIHVLR